MCMRVCVYVYVCVLWFVHIVTLSCQHFSRVELRLSLFNEVSTTYSCYHSQGGGAGNNLGRKHVTLLDCAALAIFQNNEFSFAKTNLFPPRIFQISEWGVDVFWGQDVIGLSEQSLIIPFKHIILKKHMFREMSWRCKMFKTRTPDHILTHALYQFGFI